MNKILLVVIGSLCFSTYASENSSPQVEKITFKGHTKSLFGFNQKPCGITLTYGRKKACPIMESGHSEDESAFLDATVEEQDPKCIYFGSLYNLYAWAEDDQAIPLLGGFRVVGSEENPLLVDGSTIKGGDPSSYMATVEILKNADNKPVRFDYVGRYHYSEHKSPEARKKLSCVDLIQVE